MDDDAITMFERALGLSIGSNTDHGSEHRRQPTAEVGQGSRSQSLDQRMRQVRKMTQLVLGEQPTAPLRQRLLHNATCANPMHAFTDRVAVFLDMSTDAVRRVLDLAARPADQWSGHPAPGVSIEPLPMVRRPDQTIAFLLHLAPGAQLASHGHTGAEWGLMLQGQMADDLGATEAAGDLVYHDQQHKHCVWNAGPIDAVAVNLLEGELRWV